jgi:hypothetical protein
MQPYSNPQQATSSINASNSLAGLLQTSAFPFSPKSAGGTLGTIKGLSQKRLLPDEYAKIAPVLTKEAKVAHFVRGNNAESIEPGGGQLPPGLLDEVYNLIKAGKHKDSRQASDLLDDTTISSLAFNDMASSSIMQLPKPTYVTREWNPGYPMHKTEQDSHILSTRVVDPEDTKSYAEHYWGAGINPAGAERSFMYKLPAGTHIMHPSGHADHYEALVMGETLRKAKKMGIADYLAHIAKHGSVPFAVGALGTNLYNTGGKHD